MTTFFTADQHFDHENIIRYCNRPFSTVNEMNQVMIERWNEVVGPDDDVWHLGDFLFGQTHHLKGRARKLFAQLNGNIVLFRGNHDKRLAKNFAPFVSASGYQVELYRQPRSVWVDVRGFPTEFVLSHEPPAYTNQSSLYLHGHCHHNRQSNYERQLDVGVDGYDFYPITAERALKLLMTQNCQYA